MHPKHSFLCYYLFVWVLLIHFLLAFAVRNDSVLCKETERRALLNIKHHLIDDDDFLSSWGSEEHKRECCKWEGITCSKRIGHVTKLYLYGLRLRGKMSDSLLELRHLTYLDLSCNDFGGNQFPIHLQNASLTKLTYLDLSLANFGGPVSSFLRNLSSLQYLDLVENQFTDLGNSYWVFGLSSLTSLHLSGIPLIQPTDWLEIVSNKLLHLKELDLSSCFSEDEVHTLTLSPINSSSALGNIDLSNNNLVIPSIHPWLSNISHNVYSIDLSSNILLSADFYNMISLEVLGLHNTTIEGSLAKSFGNMSRLRSLDLSYNKFNSQLSYLIRNLSGTTERSLEELHFDSNQITGSLPDELSRFSSLSTLSLSHNHLNGIISKSIGCLSELSHLDLSWNSLHGVISEHHFSNLSQLYSLDLSGNSLIWNVSHDWIPPFNLWEIILRYCLIGPHFPKWLQNQTNYGMLDISNAGISDSIPHWFWNNSNHLAYLNLSCNDIGGEVPTFSMNSSGLVIVDMSFNCLVGSLPFIQSSSTFSFINFLDLSNNLFSGVIPDYFMGFQTLISLNLANNSLYGEIPPSISYLSKLETLNLGSNKMLGHLPIYLGNCTKLNFLDLSNNKFFGYIPTWIGENLSSLQYLSLRSNKFYGIMPVQLCQLKAIQILDLSINYINGTIPHCLNNFRAMIDQNSNETIRHEYVFRNASMHVPSNYVDKAEVLWKGLNYELDKNLGRFRIINLSHNKLQGKIPKEIAILRSLHQLNLSNNMLSGSVPEEIDGLKQLQSLDLSQNHLSGRLPASMSNLNFLSSLNISHNNFSGRIPSSTQLQSFNASAFSDNPMLCGLPLTQKCLENKIQEPQPNHDSRDDEEDEFMKMVYIGMGVGFIVSFWAVSGTLLLKRTCRHAFFKLLDGWEDWGYLLRIILFKRKLLKIKIGIRSCCCL